MKKLLIGLFALSTAAMAYEMPNVYLRAGLEKGHFKAVKEAGEKYAKKTPKKLGYTLGIEATQEVMPNLELGLGLAYENHSHPKEAKITKELGIKVPNLESIPLYLTGRYYFPMDGDIKPYVKADLGYSFNHGDKTQRYSFTDKDGLNKGINKLKYKSGMYYGLGFGAEYNNVTFDIMYKMTNAKIKVDDKGFSKAGTWDYHGTKKANYSRVAFTIGYKF